MNTSLDVTRAYLALGEALKNVLEAHDRAMHERDEALSALAQLKNTDRAPETRNRISIAIESPDGAFNLTFARGDYANAVEDQRNEARAERDALRETVKQLTALLETK